MTSILMASAFENYYSLGHKLHPMSAQPTQDSHARLPWPVIACLLLGFWLRARGLDEAWINSDEGIYWFVASRETLLEFWQEIARQAHPPLFYLLLRALLSVFGASVFAVKLTLVLISLVIIWLSAKIGERLAGTLGQLCGAGLAAFSPALISMSRLVRPYSIMLLFLTLALLFYVEYAAPGSERKGRGKSAARVGLYGALACLFHYGAFLALTPIVLLFVIDRTRGHLGELLNPLLPLLLSTMFLLVTHIQPLAFYHPFEQDYATWLQAYFMASVSDIPAYLAGFAGYLWGLVFGPVFVCSSVLAALYSLASAARFGLVLVAPLLLSFFLSLNQLYPFGPARHSLYLFPALLVLILWGLGRLRQLSARNALAALLLLVALGSSWEFFESKNNLVFMPREEVVTSAEAKELFASMQTSSKETSHLYVLDPQAFFSLMPFYSQAASAQRFMLRLGADTFVLGRGWYEGSASAPTLEMAHSEWRASNDGATGAAQTKAFFVMSDGFQRSRWLDVPANVFSEISASVIFRTPHFLLLKSSAWD